MNEQCSFTEKTENGCCLVIYLREDCDKATYCREKKRFNVSKYDWQDSKMIMKFALTLKRFIYLDTSLCKSTALILSRCIRKKFRSDSALPIWHDYASLMELCVCSSKSRNCMFHLCQDCPDKENLLNFLESAFLDNGYDMEDNTTYKQWISTDRSSLTTIQSTVQEFVEVLRDKLYDLCRHHYLKESQSAFLKHSKEHLDQETCLILMDFAENYSFIAQDSVQGFYWQNSQATLHPFAVYHKDIEGTLYCESYCDISDYLKRNQTAVHCFLSKLLTTICSKHPHLQNIKYFSDGAISQYMNYKSLVDLMFYEYDHQLKAEYHFFATSHGKSPCDGISGTIKREAALASLQATVKGHILTPGDLYSWAKENIKSIVVLYTATNEIVQHKQSYSLNACYKGVKTVPGTRGYHCFIPDGERLKMKRCSNDSIGNDVLPIISSL